MIHESVENPFEVLVLSTSHVLIDLLLIVFCFQGVLVHYRAESKTSDERVELETFVQPIKHYKIIKPVGPINRMKMLQVGHFSECAISIYFMLSRPIKMFTPERLFNSGRN